LILTVVFAQVHKQVLLMVAHCFQGLLGQILFFRDILEAQDQLYFVSGGSASSEQPPK
jgi:hypothetical protein